MFISLTFLFGMFGLAVISGNSTKSIKNMNTSFSSGFCKYKKIFQKVWNGVLITDTDRNIIDCNPAFEKLFGYSLEELRGVNTRCLYTNRAHYETFGRELMENADRPGFQLCIPFKTASGEEIICEAQTSWLDEHESGSIQGYVTVFQDITDRLDYERKLEEEKKLLVSVNESSPVGIVFFDLHGTINYANGRAADILGVERSEVENYSFNDGRWRVTDSHGRTLDDEELPFSRVKRSEKPVYGIELNIRSDTGEERLLSVNAAPLFNGDDTMKGVVATFTDNTEQKNFEEKLENHREQLKMAYKAANLGTCHHDLLKGRVHLDKNARAQFGTDKKTLRFEEVLSLVHPDHVNFLENKLNSQLKPDAAGRYKLEFPVVHKNGSVRWLFIQSKVLYEEGEKGKIPVRTFGTTQDITEKKRADRQIDKLNRIYALTSEVSHNINRIRDAQCLFEKICEIAVTTGGFKMAWVGGVDREKNRVDVRASYGQHKHYQSSKSIDLNKRRQASGPTGTAIKSGAYVVSNSIHNDERMIPWQEKAEKYGFRSYAVFPIKVFGIVRGTLNLYSSQEGFFDKEEIRLLEELVADLSFALESIKHEEERRQTELALQESENRYRNLVEFSPYGIGIFQGGRLVFINPAAAKLFRVDNSEKLLGRTIEDIVHPYDLENARKRMKDLMSGKTERYNAETYYLAADGSPVPIQVTVAPMMYRGKPAAQVIAVDITERKRAENELKKLYEGIEKSPALVVITDRDGKIEYVNPQFLETTGYDRKEVIGQNPRFLKSGKTPEELYKQLWNTITGGDTWQGEFINRKKDGENYIFSASISPIIDKNGVITNFIGVGEDVTPRRENENRLRKALNEKTLLLSEIHHRVKNNLAIISGIMELQAMESESEDFYCEMKRSQSRINSIAFIHEILYREKDFSNIDFGKNIECLVHNIVNTFDAEVGLSFDTKPVSLNINHAIPCSLLVNEIVTNALKHAFEKTEDARIEIALHEKKGRVYLSIADNGIGLQEDYAPENSGSLGMQLIQNLKSQLEADLEVHTSGGTAYRLSFANTRSRGAGSLYF